MWKSAKKCDKLPKRFCPLVVALEFFSEFFFFQKVPSMLQIAKATILFTPCAIAAVHNMERGRLTLTKRGVHKVGLEMTKLCATIACQYTVSTSRRGDIVLRSRSPRQCHYPLFAYPLFKRAQNMQMTGLRCGPPSKCRHLSSQAVKSKALVSGHPHN